MFIQCWITVKQPKNNQFNHTSTLNKHLVLSTIHFQIYSYGKEKSIFLLNFAFFLKHFYKITMFWGESNPIIFLSKFRWTKYWSLVWVILYRYNIVSYRYRDLNIVIHIVSWNLCIVASLVYTCHCLQNMSQCGLELHTRHDHECYMRAFVRDLNQEERLWLNPFSLGTSSINSWRDIVPSTAGRHVNESSQSVVNDDCWGLEQVK